MAHRSRSEWYVLYLVCEGGLSSNGTFWQLTVARVWDVTGLPIHEDSIKDEKIVPKLEGVNSGPIDEKLAKSMKKVQISGDPTDDLEF